MADSGKIVRNIQNVRDREFWRHPAAELRFRMRSIVESYQDLCERYADDIKAYGSNRQLIQFGIIEITELVRYFPVALLALTESYIRSYVSALINMGPPYTENAKLLMKSDKFDFELLEALHGRFITLGEIVAKLIRVASIADIDKIMSAVLGVDFLAEVGRVHSRYEVEIKEQIERPIVVDMRETRKYVARTFELRHIFCHEFATNVDFTIEEIDKCINHMIQFLKAVDQLFQNSIDPSAPLTQQQFNERAMQDYSEKRKTMDQLVEEVKERLDPDKRTQFVAVQECWKQYLIAEANFSGDKYAGPVMRQMIFAFAAEQEVDNRIATLREHVRKLNLGP